MVLTNEMLRRIGEVFPLPDSAEEKELKVSGMKFQISAYEVAGLGHVSAMTASGFFGLMKMDTLIITPTEVDMPLFSYDRVNAMGNDTLIFELYDTLLGHADLSMLAGVKAAAQSAAPCEAKAKREKAAVYVEGLLTHGGPSTDVFKKGIGEEQTARLFRKTLFATEV